MESNSRTLAMFCRSASTVKVIAVDSWTFYDKCSSLKQQHKVSLLGVRVCLTNRTGLRAKTPADCSARMIREHMKLDLWDHGHRKYKSLAKLED